eukprot:m.308206 g.308206  ORF g.308206 m.308206 type:complete len:300 (+) comp16472_c0_seq33:205-1104(+)
MSSTESVSKRVLSIQSHVVHGHVGNKSAVFPLQLLGFDVDAMNTVQFSNHTGYQSFKGKVLNADDLWDLFEGVVDNELAKYTHILTGYMGSAPLLRTVVKIVQRLKEINPNIVYVCDPVLGDEGKLYVPKELVDIYWKEVIPVANIVTPNQYEVELLTGQDINSKDEALALLPKFHEKGVNTVVLTSLNYSHLDHIDIVASHSISENNTRKVGLTVPKVSGAYTGTGDLFAALLLAHLYKDPSDLAIAIEKTVATLQAVIKRTLAHARGSELKKDTELQLIQSKGDIENPVVEHKVIPL